jgi:uncharacterized protein (DUF433 family)
MLFQNRIVSDHRILLGRPFIKGTRVTVQTIMDKLSDGYEVNSLLALYPSLTEDDIQVALMYPFEKKTREEIIAMQ